MKTSRIMLIVLIALVPGTIAMTWHFGTGVLVNLALAALFSTLVELLVLRLRGLELRTLRDNSALVTAALLALSLPPSLPAWMIFTGCVFAIVFAKHLYGGLGQNLFNPAMVGFCVLIVSFPLAMSTWNPSVPVADGMSGATPLDSFRFRGPLTVDEYWQSFGEDNWQVWMLVNAGFLAGGICLLYLRVITWMAPLAMLATLAALSLVFHDGGSSESLGSPLFHLFSGGTMLAAFFIVTDPVTTPDTVPGQAIFGIGVGTLTFIIRSVGAYPEGIAFAVLLMNGCTPLIDQILLPRKGTTGTDP